MERGQQTPSLTWHPWHQLQGFPLRESGLPAHPGNPPAPLGLTPRSFSPSSSNSSDPRSDMASPPPGASPRSPPCVTHRASPVAKETGSAPQPTRPPIGEERARRRRAPRESSTNHSRESAKGAGC